MEFISSNGTCSTGDVSISTNNIQINMVESEPEEAVTTKEYEQSLTPKETEQSLTLKEYEQSLTPKESEPHSTPKESDKPNYSEQVEMNYNAVDMILESEKQNNKLDTWNKLDKTGKIIKLHAFAEKYGRTHNLPTKDIKILKTFFIECLEKAKLQKAKDVVYNKETGEILSIPSLHFNTTNQKFTLKIMDAKRVSTLKCLTPKRISEKTRENVIS
jgi:hypothetical protein